MKDIIEKVKVDDRVKLEFNLTHETVAIHTPNGRKNMPISSLATIPDEMCKEGGVETAPLLKAKAEAQALLRLIKTFPSKEELLDAVRRTRHPQNEAEKNKKVVLEAYQFTIGMNEKANRCIAEIQEEGNVMAFMEAASDFAPYAIKYESKLLPVIASIGVKTTDDLAGIIGDAKAQELVSVTKDLNTKFKIIFEHMAKIKRRLE